MFLLKIIKNTFAQLTADRGTFVGTAKLCLINTVIQNEALLTVVCTLHCT